MNKLRYLSCLCVFLLLFSGCGKTNVLQWAAPGPDHDNIEQARLAIDEAKYDKALSLVRDDTSNEGQILYAQALLGKSGLDLASILDALTDDKIIDNPVIRLDKLMHKKNNTQMLLQSGDIYMNVNPSKKSDQVIGVLASMAAHTANLKEAFDQGDIGLENALSGYNPADDVSLNYQALCGASSTGDLDNATRYVRRAAELYNLISKDEELDKALKTMRETMVSVNIELERIDEFIGLGYPSFVYDGVTYAISPGYRPWVIVKALFDL